jgi:hypothetical protein
VTLLSLQKAACASRVGNSGQILDTVNPRKITTLAPTDSYEIKRTDNKEKGSDSRKGKVRVFYTVLI